MNRVGRIWTLKWIIVALAVLTSHGARAAVIDPSQAILVKLALSGPPAPGVDVIVLDFWSYFLEPDGSLGGFPLDTTFSASLYNGTELLGADTPSLQPYLPEAHRSFYFSSLSSPFAFDHAPHVDFSSILDTTIDGSLLITFDRPISIELEGAPGSYHVNLDLGFGRASGPDLVEIDNTTGYLYATSYSIVANPAPEPSPLLLGLVATCAAVGWRRSARRAK